tara:strand:+ start:1112 stop:1840 length:729 start_codon:yes stop_codon:yes gene_type:complete
MWRIGIDEAGRGPAIGPLVVGALRVPAADLPLLHEAGITDSKLLSKGKREELYQWILEQSEERGWSYEIRISAPAEIDRAMAMTNLNDHEVSLFASLARKLRTDGGGILQLDACDADANRFGNNVASRLPEWPWGDWSIESMHGADLHCLAVAGASILAKVTRDKVIEQISKDLEIDVGSGYPSDPKTIEAVAILVQNELPHDCLRWGWATVKNAWESAHNAPLPLRPADPDAPPNAQRTLF